MNIEEATQIFSDTNCYGSMSIAKPVILNYLQERIIGYCKDCKHFEYDSVANVDGSPLIVAHEICKRWGDGCKTKEAGYCFLFESQESEETKNENIRS